MLIVQIYQIGNNGGLGVKCNPLLTNQTDHTY